MWFTFAVFLALWLISMGLTMPVPIQYTFFTAMLVMGGSALRERYLARRHPD